MKPDLMTAEVTAESPDEAVEKTRGKIDRTHTITNFMFEPAGSRGPAGIGLTGNHLARRTSNGAQQFSASPAKTVFHNLEDRRILQKRG